MFENLFFLDTVKQNKNQFNLQPSSQPREKSGTLPLDFH